MLPQFYMVTPTVYLNGSRALAPLNGSIVDTGTSEFAASIVNIRSYLTTTVLPQLSSWHRPPLLPLSLHKYLMRVSLWPILV